MNDHFKPGDRVRFRAGRGYSEGTVANVSDDKVLINTAKGKSLTRKLPEVALVVTVPAEATEAASA